MSRLNHLTFFKALVAAFVLIGPVAQGDPTVETAIQCPEGSLLVEGHSEDGRRASWCEVEGKKAGPYVEFFENGRLRARGAFHRGRKSGEFVFWHENGAKESQGEFEDDLHVGEWTRWYENGKVRDQGEWDRDQPHGDWRAWYENGNPKFSGAFDRGQKEGLWTEWYSSGIKREESKFKRGKQQCLIGSWDETGRRTAKFKSVGAAGCERISGEPGLDWRMMEVSIRGATFSMGTKRNDDNVNHGGVGFAWLPTYQTGWKWLRFRGVLGMTMLGDGRSEDGSTTNDGFRTYQAGALVSFVPFKSFFGEVGLVHRHVPVDDRQSESRNSGYFRLGWQSEQAFLGFIHEIAVSHQAREYPDGQKVSFGSLDIGFRL